MRRGAPLERRVNAVQLRIVGQVRWADRTRQLRREQEDRFQARLSEVERDLVREGEGLDYRIYRVTHNIVPWVLLTPNQKFRLVA